MNYLSASSECIVQVHNGSIKNSQQWDKWLRNLPKCHIYKILLLQVTPKKFNITMKIYKVDWLLIEGFTTLCALFTNVPAEAKHFSVTTQTQNINIISILDSIKSTECNYKELLKKLKKNPSYLFQLPTLKVMAETTESKEDNSKSVYQNKKDQLYSRKRHFIQSML